MTTDFTTWEWRLRWKTTKPWCFRCIYLVRHFFHDNGTSVEGWLKADPACQKCLDGVGHTFHDRKAFNQDDYLRR